ncbi:MAG TPA: SDR family oxidoreductase [Solirubrobacteraceae bacterium]|jgi:NAD(P)-dependent dehydrogenase (short-subunit alcohol dehydrogenase family)|nr:SDR family oxidoreductase [Solirubrobacteraceae bacterium]
MSRLEGKSAIVVGASRGLGRGVAQSLSAAGASVLAIARGEAELSELTAADPSIIVRAADARDPSVAADTIAARDPGLLAVVAGASPQMHPIHQQTWESFSENWQVDVQLTFNWLREALRKPLRPGSRVLLMSSGAAVAGSPLSGGYAGAKATIRFMAAYADEEARRSELGIRVLAVLPKLTPATALGQAAVRGYAERNGISEEQYASRFGAPLTPELAGTAFLELAAGELSDDVAYLLTGDSGLAALPARG